MNANVLWFIGDRPETADAARWVIDEARKDAPLTWYYPSPAMLDHAIARAIAAGTVTLSVLRPLLVERAWDRIERDVSALDTVLSSAILGFLGVRAPKALDKLVGLQGPDGSWPAQAFWTGPEAPAPPTMFWGSRALTTALALEALAMWPGVRDR